ncbi:hypothetical protein AK812_SmicGene30885 [Symbiodinium microadriaticum]|uniref:Uncharacterized protein n=1 Tax=Symbiodinium microadriaticum TaxID=2951 RepID=A0A1Q9CY43_SYMMI|nr:hypothetical protein AK812_SmicGene30885 [Symbiodinium microadriaticum]
MVSDKGRGFHSSLFNDATGSTSDPPKTAPPAQEPAATSPTPMDMPYIPEEPMGAVMQERVTDLFGMQLAAQERRAHLDFALLRVIATE